MNLLSRNASFLACAALSLCIAALDAWRGVNFSLWALHLIPMALASWNLGARAGWSMAVLAVALLCAEALWVGHPFTSLADLAWAYASRAAAYALVVYCVGRLRQKEVSRVYVPPLGAQESSH